MTNKHFQDNLLASGQYDAGFDMPNNTFPLPWPKLYYFAGYQYFGIAKRIISSNWGLRSIRNQQLVSSHYETAWNKSNEEFIRDQDARRDIYLVKSRPIYTDGWFITKTYVDLLLNVICQFDVDSVLEVGTGRGKNLTLLALRRPDLQFTGLELTHHGVEQSRQLAANLPQKFLAVAGCPVLTQEQKTALEGIRFLRADALQMPFPDKSFDFSFTCLVLEQIPRHYTQALQEMQRVTRKYCAFIEPFTEANNFLGRAYLRSVDYFRDSCKRFAKFGLKPIYFTTAFPQKLTFKVGLLIAQIIN